MGGASSRRLAGGSASGGNRRRLHIVVMIGRGYREAVRTDKLVLRAGSRVKIVGNTAKAGGACLLSIRADSSAP